MTARDQALFAAGIETARQMAMIAAVSIEVRADAGDLRQQAAIAALQGLAEGLKATFLDRDGADPCPSTDPTSIASMPRPRP